MKDKPVSRKQAEARLKKYRKIWKERGCLHWRKDEDK